MSRKVHFSLLFSTFPLAYSSSVVIASSSTGTFLLRVAAASAVAASDRVKAAAATNTLLRLLRDGTFPLEPLFKFSLAVSAEQDTRLPIRFFLSPLAPLVSLCLLDPLSLSSLSRSLSFSHTLQLV